MTVNIWENAVTFVNEHAGRKRSISLPAFCFFFQSPAGIYLRANLSDLRGARE